MKYCPNCNTGNKPEAKYCQSCGHKFANTNVASLSGDSKTSSVNQTALVSSILKAAAIGAVTIGGLLLKRHLSKQDSTTPQEELQWELPPSQTLPSTSDQEESKRAQNKMRYAPENVFPVPPRVRGTPTPEEALKKKSEEMSSADMQRDINRMMRKQSYPDPFAEQLDYIRSKYGG